MKHSLVTLGSAIALVTALTPAPAAACGGSYLFFPKRDHPLPSRVSAGAVALADGDYYEAVEWTRAAFDDLHQLPAEPTIVLPEPPRKLALFVTAQHVLAMTAVRSNGDYGPWSAERDTDRRNNLMWAAFVTQFHAAVRPDDPGLLADAAEAAAAVPTLEPVAYEILIDLQGRDLLPDAHSYALLARLQQQRGELEASELSLLGCTHLTENDGACLSSEGPNA